MGYTSFEWDEAKNRDNIRKHGISFASATSLFDYPHLARLDDREDCGEERWTAIGWIGPMMGVVVFAEREHNECSRMVRMISARKALRHEMALYEKEIPY